MPNWETVASGEKIDINKCLDFREYDTTADRDAASTGWGSLQLFRICRVVETGYYYYWNGASWARFPAAGGAGAPTDASYVTINAEAELSAETQHKNITGANLHDPKSHTHTESEVTDLDHDAQKIKGKTVDDAAIGDDKILVYKTAGTKLVYEAKPSGGGDMYKTTYDANANNIVDNSEKLEGSTKAQVQDHTPKTHAPSHTTGSTDPFLSSHLLDAIAKTTVRKNTGSNIGSRRRLNFIEGSGISLTITDDSGNEEVDVNISTTGGASYKLAPEYTVYKVGSTYYAMDSDGNVDYSGSNAHTVINNAIGNLTNGRDHMETVLSKGEITITDSIQLDSYTRLMIGGELKAGTTGFDMITFSDTAQYHVEICGGGLINGDDKADDGIHLYQASSQPSWRSFIHDLTIINCEENGIWTDGAVRLIGSDIYIYLCDQDGMHIDSYDSKFLNIVVGEAGVHGIHNDSTNNHFANCKCYGAGQVGFYLNGARAGTVNCVAQENDQHGFFVANTDQVLAGCISDRNSLESAGTYHGFYIYGDRITLTGCSACAFKTEYCQQDGIYIHSTASNVRVAGFVTDGNLLGKDINIHSSATGISIWGIDDEFQTDSGAWTAPSTAKVSAYEGRVVTQYNPDQTPTTRKCIYAGGAWRYIEAAT